MYTIFALGENSSQVILYLSNAMHCIGQTVKRRVLMEPHPAKGRQFEASKLTFIKIAVKRSNFTKT